MKSSLNLTKLKIGAILNTDSGSCDIDSEEKMMAILTAANIQNPKIWCGGADLVGKHFTEAAAHKLDVLIVLGGDGTIRTGAEICTKKGPYLIALPGGTMNMLPKALYGSHGWEEVLTQTLANPTVKEVSGGEIEGKQFFIAAILGGPALWAHAREAIRGGDFLQAVDKGIIAFQNMFNVRVKYSFSTKDKGETEAVAVICPLISEVLPSDERAFEAAAINVRTAAEIVGLASSAAFGKWREYEHVQVVKTKKIRVSSSREIPVIIDGESVSIGKKLTVTFVPVAFKALVPAA